MDDFLFYLCFSVYTIIRLSIAIIRSGVIRLKGTKSESDDYQQSISNADKAIWALGIFSIIGLESNFFFQDFAPHKLVAIYVIIHFCILVISRRWKDRNIYEKFISTAGILYLSFILFVQFAAHFIGFVIHSSFDGRDRYDAEKVYEKALYELREGDTATALDYLDSSISLYPANGMYLIQSADLRLLCGDKEGSCTRAKEAQQLGEDIDISVYCD